MKVLDCTLRDGGYYNHWDFEPTVVNAYLDAVSKSNIDVVELGLRGFPSDKFLGPFAYTTEEYINRLTLPDNVLYGVMVDAKTILSSKFNINDAVNSLFVEKAASKISLVRIAAHLHEVDDSERIAKILKDKGYIVGFNLMQCGGKSSELIESKAKIIKSWACVDVLYFADSLGNMDQNEVVRIIRSLRLHWDGDLGIHTHNNMTRALDNTLCASYEGVAWLDVTVSGMGRGAGNAQTENLLAVLSRTQSNYRPEPIYDLVIRYFEPMQKIYGWGSNLLYFIGAQNNIHPTYIQNLLSDKRYGPDEVIGAISFLSTVQSSNYSGKLLDEALMPKNFDSDIGDTDDITGFFKHRDVLIIGGGPSVNKYLEDIKSYIQKNNPIVISININDLIEQDYIDFYIVSHNVKYLSDRKKYASINKPIILPLHRFSAEEQRSMRSKVQVINYGLQVQADKFYFGADRCIIPSELTIAYGIAAVMAGGAESINLVGMDGYDNNDSRQQEITTLWVDLQEKYKDKNIIALTPTVYPIKKSSLYAPII